MVVRWMRKRTTMVNIAKALLENGIITAPIVILNKEKRKENR